MSILAEPADHKSFTREEYHFLADNGLLQEGRYELLDGDIREIMPSSFLQKHEEEEESPSGILE